MMAEGRGHNRGKLLINSKSLPTLSNAHSQISEFGEKNSIDITLLTLVLQVVD